MAEPLLSNELPDNVVYRNLLLSHGITRLATQGWLFIAPLVLVRFTPGRLIGPAVWGLVTMLGSALLAPPLGAWADQTDRRWVVTLGVSAQAVAVLGSTLVLFLALQGADARVADGSAAPVALAAFTCFSVLEKLGTALSDVAVKREWAPRLFQGDRLKRTNSMMSQIDLWSETLGPFLAGLLITGLDDVFGFVAVGLLNILSFPPQLLLLRRIYAARAAKLQPLRPEEVHRKANPLTPKTGAWSAWLHHPSGIQFLGLSYSLLYLTVFSPHGAFLTAHLAQRHVPSYQLSLLRGAGALLGVTGVLMHPPAQELLGARVADAVFVLWLAGWTVMALDAFHRAPDAGMTPTLLLFMSAVCLARPGLYGFELGVLNTEQDFSDARHRSAIGAVDSALTSFATLAMYGSGLVLTRPDQFVVLVDGSTLFVSLGAATYLVWLLLYHSHKHRHSTPGSPVS
ncbi:Solute carrier family 40 member 1, partial [Durusdinium trenchii]